VAQPDGWKNASKIHFVLQILINVVSVFQSRVFSCLQSLIVAIIKRGLGDASGCKNSAGTRDVRRGS